MHAMSGHDLGCASMQSKSDMPSHSHARELSGFSTETLIPSLIASWPHRHVDDHDRKAEADRERLNAVVLVHDIPSWPGQAKAEIVPRMPCRRAEPGE